MTIAAHKTERLAYSRRSLYASFLIGFGMMAAVDEIVFHQLLRWHHFFDRSTPAVGLIADGLLHVAELIFIVAGFFRLADLRRRHVLVPGWAWAGFFLGLGVFQLFDGVINHKVLRIHQVRYGVHLLPYDIAWNLAGLAFIVVGVWLLYRAGSAEPNEDSSGAGTR